MKSLQQLSASSVIAFGPFRLFPTERRLELDGVPLKVGSRALDILICLAEHPGELLSTRTLMERVWQGLVVEESSLRVNISNLRRAMGDDSVSSRYIVNIPGRGYCFVAQPSEEEGGYEAHRANTLPCPLRQMVGRAELVEQLSAQLRSQRFITLVGAGGMGKTTVAIAVAHSLREEFSDAVCFLDLTTFSDPELLPSTLLATFGLPPEGHALHILSAWLQEKKYLLVLDNCEHLIDAVADLAEQLYQTSPQLHILATSREALRVRGEHTHRLQPLAYPPDNQTMNAEQALAYPAVQLFMARVRATGAPFELSDRDATLVAQICCHLDGVALAIELLASRVATFGLHGTAAFLYNGMLLSLQGCRNALPRHRTLTAMLDWSYHLLPEDERAVLRRLSVFAGCFLLESALAVVSDTPLRHSSSLAAIESLVAKSLLSIESAEYGAGYRLQESTRAYAAQKLIASGEAPLIFQRNAEQMIIYLEQITDASAIFPAKKPTPRQLKALGNLRTSISWCFSEEGNAILGARLCAAAMPILQQFSLLEEGQHWSEKAIAAIAGQDGYEREELVLQEARATNSMFKLGNCSNVRNSIERGLELAQLLGDRRHELRLLAGLNMYQARLADFGGALAVAVRGIAIAKELKDPAALAMGEWMLGSSYHLAGNQSAAQRHCERGMTLIEVAGNVSTSCFGYDHKIRAMISLARAIWLQGKHAQALEITNKAIAEAEQVNHPACLCLALIYGSSIFVWNGDWDRVEALVEQLSEHTDRHMLELYRTLALGLKGQLLVQRGQARAGVTLLSACIETLQAGHYMFLNSVFMAALAEGLIALGEMQDAKAVIEQAATMGADTFHASEIARIQNIIAS